MSDTALNDSTRRQVVTIEVGLHGGRNAGVLSSVGSFHLGAPLAGKQHSRRWPGAVPCAAGHGIRPQRWYAALTRMELARNRSDAAVSDEGRLDLDEAGEQPVHEGG